MSKRIATVLPLIVLLLVSCSSEPKPDGIVLVIIDTCRADRVGAVRGEDPVTPFLDAFADRAATFTQAFSHAPWTLPSVASLFTSQIPLRHGAGGRLGEFRSLPESAVTLAEACRDAGMNTAAVTNVQFLSAKYGTVQGFDSLDVYEPESNLDTRRAADTTDAALTWLRKNGKDPFLLLVHYFDPHLVYDPPEPYLSRFAPFDGKDARRKFGKFSQIKQIRDGEMTLSPGDYERLGALYDGEVAYTDAHFGRLLEGLTELGIAARAVVAVVSDHGEEFNDHGSLAHGHTQYDELLHVPLMIHVPGAMAQGTRVSVPVALRDVAPTLCEFAGIPVPPAFTGRSLAPVFDGRSLEPLPIVSQGNMWEAEQAALRLGKWKVIVESVPDPGEESVSRMYRLFDLEKDPGETTNLAQDEPVRLAAMLARLEAELAGPRTEGQEPELSESERERLRSLGYVR